MLQALFSLSMILEYWQRSMHVLFEMTMAPCAGLQQIRLHIAFRVTKKSWTDRNMKTGQHCSTQLISFAVRVMSAGQMTGIPFHITRNSIKAGPYIIQRLTPPPSPPPPALQYLSNSSNTDQILFRGTAACTREKILKTFRKISSVTTNGKKRLKRRIFVPNSRGWSSEMLLTPVGKLQLLKQQYVSAEWWRLTHSCSASGKQWYLIHTPRSSHFRSWQQIRYKINSSFLMEGRISGTESKTDGKFLPSPSQTV